MNSPMRSGRTWVALVLATLCVPLAALAAEEGKSPPKMLGVVTCAGSTCHGLSAPSDDTTVLQNEFTTWHRQDAHAKAWQVLKDEKGQRIARNLGLEDPTTARECVGCHVGLVAGQATGRQFRAADGVGCEACHGAAADWLGLHVTGDANRAALRTAGLYPTEEPAARATLCLRCHQGDTDHVASHRLMGAGHPRLSFELDTFTTLEPAHYRVDADYKRRKPAPSHADTWAVGQLAAAERLLTLLADDPWQTSGVRTDFAFYDCHACHHPLDTPRWAPRPSHALPPGVPHVNDANLLMLTLLLDVLDGTQASRVREGVLALHKASLESASTLKEAAGALRDVVRQARPAASRQPLDRTQMKAVLMKLVAAGKAGELQDYATAEQAVMAAHALLDGLADAGAHDATQRAALEAQVKPLYALVEKPAQYQPAPLVAALEALGQSLP